MLFSDLYIVLVHNHIIIHVYLYNVFTSRDWLYAYAQFCTAEYMAQQLYRKLNTTFFFISHQFGYCVGVVPPLVRALYVYPVREDRSSKPRVVAFYLTKKPHIWAFAACYPYLMSGVSRNVVTIVWWCTTDLRTHWASNTRDIVI